MSEVISPNNWVHLFPVGETFYSVDRVSIVEPRAITILRHNKSEPDAHFLFVEFSLNGVTKHKAFADFSQASYIVKTKEEAILIQIEVAREVVAAAQKNVEHVTLKLEKLFEEALLLKAEGYK